jgi:hypothetical protein
VASLLIVRGPLSGFRIRLEKEHTIIGRNRDCDVVVPSHCMSRRHSRITRRGERYFLEDLDSASGTYLNLAQIRGLSPLRDGDRIGIPVFEVIFDSPEEPMTEADWFASTDPQRLLGWSQANIKLSERRIRLFIAACIRQFDLADHHDPVVAARERDADATADATSLAELWQAATGAVRKAVEKVSAPFAWPNHAREGRPPRRQSEDEQWTGLEHAEEVLCHLLRDIIANPFRPPLVASSVLAWQDGDIGRLADATHDDRLLPSGHLDSARIGVLCDALEDAGCPPDNEALIHLRGPGPHVRGCFAVDLLRGMK